MTPDPDIRFLAHVWGANRGRTGYYRAGKPRPFRTMAGAVRFAVRESGKPGVIEVSITDETGRRPRDGYGPRVAVYRRGTLHVIRHTDNTKATLKENDMSTDKPAKTKPARARALTVDQLLGLSDRSVADVPVERRPALPDGTKLPAAPYAAVYARFLTGERKLYPNPWMSQTSAEDGAELRRKVRAAIGRAAGVKPANPTGAAGSRRTAVAATRRRGATTTAKPRRRR